MEGLKNLCVEPGVTATVSGVTEIHANEGGFATDSVTIGEVGIEEVLARLFDLTKTPRGSYAGKLETLVLPRVLLTIQVLGDDVPSEGNTS